MAHLYDVYYAGPRGVLSADCDFRTASLPRVGRDARNGSLARQITGEETLLLAVNGEWREATQTEWDAAWRAAEAKRDAAYAKRAGSR